MSNIQQHSLDRIKSVQMLSKYNVSATSIYIHKTNTFFTPRFQLLRRASMSLSSKERVDFFKWMPWNTKEKKEGREERKKEVINQRERGGGRRKKGIRKRDKGGGKRERKKKMRKDRQTKYMSFRVIRVLCTFLVMLYCPQRKGLCYNWASSKFWVMTVYCNCLGLWDDFAMYSHRTIFQKKTIKRIF